VAAVVLVRRDRKGLAGNLISPLANIMLCLRQSALLRHWAPDAWHVGELLPAWLQGFCRLTMGNCGMQTACAPSLRASLRWRFAAAVPIRMVFGNVCNFAATVNALWEFWDAHRAAGSGRGARRTMFTVAQPAMATAVLRVRLVFVGFLTASAAAAAGEFTKTRSNELFSSRVAVPPPLARGAG
jgi:hypothetical protein